MNFRKFQQTRDNQYLGICIQVLPLILEIQIIRLYLEHLFYDLSKANNKKAIKNLDKLFKGLKIDIKKRLDADRFAFDDWMLKEFFELFYSYIKENFNKNKPKTRDKRAELIKQIFGRARFLFLDKLCSFFAIKTEPRRIAIDIVRYIERYERNDDLSFLENPKTRFKPPDQIGIGKFNKIIANS